MKAAQSGCLAAASLAEVEGMAAFSGKEVNTDSFQGPVYWQETPGDRPAGRLGASGEVAMLRQLLLVPLVLGSPFLSLPLPAEAERKSQTVNPPGGVECFALDPTGAWLATGGGDGTIQLWDLRAPDPWARSRLVLRGHEKPVEHLAISPNGRWLASSAAGVLRLWNLAARDLAAGSLLLQPSGPRLGMVTFSGNSRWLVAGPGEQEEKTIAWDLRADDPRAKPIVLPTRAALDVCPNHRWLLGGVRPKAETIPIWDLQADDPWAKPVVVRLAGGTSEREIAPDGRWLFARHRDVRDPSRQHFLVKTDKGGQSPCPRPGLARMVSAGAGWRCQSRWPLAGRRLRRRTVQP
jgi:hypothetical protein